VVLGRRVVAADGGGQKEEREWLVESTELGEGLRRQVGRADRQRQLNNMEATLRRRCVAVQHLSPAGLQRHPSLNGTLAGADWQLQYDGQDPTTSARTAAGKIFWKDRDNVNHETLVDRSSPDRSSRWTSDGILATWLDAGRDGRSTGYRGSWTKDLMSETRSAGSRTGGPVMTPGWQTARRLP